MASVFCDTNGRCRILYYFENKRYTFRLGKVSEQIAKDAKERIEGLVSARRSGTSPGLADMAWARKLDAKLRKRLEKLGLLRSMEGMTLGEWIDRYMAERGAMKEMTLANLGQCRDYLLKYFGKDKPLAAIGQGDCDEWRQWLSHRCKGEKGLGDNTVRRHCGRARQFFRDAVRKGLLAENPFGDMKDIAVQANEDRFRFVTLDELAAVLKACPNNHWRAQFLLARIGGLRVPSESRLLKWADIDWGKNLMTVTSSGKGERTVPLFPELRELLDQMREEADDESVYILDGMRHASSLGTQSLRIIRRAGLKPWQKPFQNLRASRVKELVESRSSAECSEWLGAVFGVCGTQPAIPKRRSASSGDSPEWYGGVMTTGLEGGMMVTPLGVGCVLEMDDGKWLVRWADAETTAPSFEQAKSLCEYYYYGSIPASQR